MKKYFLIFLLLPLSVVLFSQDLTIDKNSQQKLTKQEKKAAKEAIAARTAAIVDNMVTHGTFVLEANMLYDRYGNSVNVPSSINFIASDSLNGVLQIGNNSYVGNNGVGGTTIEGRINSYKVVKNEKKGYYNVSYILTSATGAYDVMMSVSIGGYADATIKSNWPGSLRYTGKLVPPQKSKVFKGTARY